jgi:hypothetical protein
VENIAPQREDHSRHWSTGDIVMVRSKTADNWRDTYVLIQRGQKLLLVISEGMIYPDGTRQTRLSLMANGEPESITAPMMGRTTKLDHHHASATMADTDGMPSFSIAVRSLCYLPWTRHLKTTRRTHARLLCGPSGPALVELSLSAHQALLSHSQVSRSGNAYRVGGS